MTNSSETIRIGTRASALARWQTDYVGRLLSTQYPTRRIEIQVFSTRGDEVLDQPLPEVGGKGLFTAELEAALRSGAIDLAVHSLKDLPVDDSPGLVVGAVPVRVDPSDVLVSRSRYTLRSLPDGATVGTSSVRRGAQLRYTRPDLKLHDIRGNIDTRLRKALDPNGPYDAVLLAHAGLERLELTEHISEVLDLEIMLPAPGQGALSIQCRDEAEALSLLAPIEHAETRLAVEAERAFLARLGGGCSVPIGALAGIIEAEGGRQIRLNGRVSAPDGSGRVNLTQSAALTGDRGDDLQVAHDLGTLLADLATKEGAATYLCT
ncbi:MAG: hydroxymethylbilane synthase [Planctomycetes bacterium]|nr:hydroxymethylbilane synthase [Planctomycetota bacterium]